MSEIETESEILKRIINKLNNKLIYFYLIKNTNNFNYNDILNIWYEYRNKYNFISEKIYQNKYRYNLMLYISLYHYKFSQLLDKIFSYHFMSISENLIVIYKNYDDKILYILKSYKPLLKSKNINLPYWYLLEPIPKSLKTYYQRTYPENQFIISIY